VLFRNMLPFQGEEFLAHRPIGKLDDYPLVLCPRLLVQYIRRYTPYLEAFSICSQKTRHVVMTGSPLPRTRDYENCDMESFKRILTVHNVVIWSKVLTLRSATRVLRSWVRVPFGEWLVARFLVSVLYCVVRKHTMGRSPALCPLSNVYQQDWD